MIISNHLKNKIPFPKGTIVRVNTAWVKDKQELYKILDSNKDFDIFLDFPDGRRKPPKPVLKFDTLLKAVNKYKNIKYFAISNAENIKFLKELRREIPKRVELIPKIETLDGVIKFKKIATVCNTETLMLDKDDLYQNVGAYSPLYDKAVSFIRTKSKEYGLKILELQGVVFE